MKSATRLSAGGRRHAEPCATGWSTASHTRPSMSVTHKSRATYISRGGKHVKTRAAGEGTKAKPWKLRTPSGSSEYEMYRAEDVDPPAIVCTVGKTELRYHLRAIEDLHSLLQKQGDWRVLGVADDQKTGEQGTVEASGAET